MKKRITLFAIAIATMVFIVSGCAITSNGPSDQSDAELRLMGRSLGLIIVVEKPEIIPDVRKFCALIEKKPDLGKLNLIDMALSYLEKEYSDIPGLQALVKDILIVCGVSDWFNADIRADAIVDMVKDMDKVKGIVHSFEMITQGICEGMGV